MDVRQMIAKKVVEKRRRESSEAMSSEKIRTNKVSTKAASQEGEFDCTPKICHKIKAGIKVRPTPIQNNHAPKSDRSSSNGSRQTPSSNNTMRGQTLQQTNCKHYQSIRTTTWIKWQLKTKDGHTSEAKRLTKSTIASTMAGSITASMKLPSEKSSLQELPPSVSVNRV